MNGDKSESQWCSCYAHKQIAYHYRLTSGAEGILPFTLHPAASIEHALCYVNHSHCIQQPPQSMPCAMSTIHTASSSLHRACLVLCQTHLIFVVDVDSEPKWSGAESLIGNEAILKGCLAFGLNHTVEGHWSELQQPYTKKLNMMHRDLMPKLLFKNIHQYYRMGRAPT